MKSPREWLRVARMVAIAGAVVGLGYLASRFSVVPLPEDGCSPVARFAPGERLLVDSSPRPFEVGDAVLVRDQRGTLQLTRVERLRSEDGALWCGGNVAACPGYGSATAGWIGRDAVAGRVLFSWSF